MSKSNEHMRKYLLARYFERRNYAVNLLGGKCVYCGSLENLELDHIDPKTKYLNLAKQMSTVTEVLFLLEIAKCQLLCKPCHLAKTVIDAGNKPAKGTHGTLSAYRYCRCELCKAAHKEYSAKYTKETTYLRNYKRRLKRSQGK